jgi:hypothetical protein
LLNPTFNDFNLFFENCLLTNYWGMNLTRKFQKPTIPKYHTTYRLNPFNEVDKNANKIQYQSFF